MEVAAVVMPAFDAWLRESPAPVIDHWRFGVVRASVRRECQEFVWECLDLVATQRGPADLEFEASAWGPTADHERQLDEIVRNLDALTKAAARAIAAHFKESFDHRPNGPWTGLEWQGARLCGRMGTFQLHYWCKAGPELLIAVSFEGSQPVGVHIHD
jgi:hypothetical protein